MKSKKGLTILLTGVMALSMSFTAFAGRWIDVSIGWQYDKTGYGSLAHDEWFRQSKWRLTTVKLLILRTL